MPTALRPRTRPGSGIRAWVGRGLAALLCVASVVADAASGVGTVTSLRGSAVRVAADGTRQQLAEGAMVLPKDRIETSADSFAVLDFTDHTRFSLGADTVFRIDDVRSDGADAGFSAAVLKGAFRFVTGLIAKQRPRAMRVQTGAVATIGIRGTTVGGEVEGESAKIVLLPNPDSDTPSAIEVGNDFGHVVIDEPGFGTVVPDAHSPPSPPARMSLRTVDNLVRNLTNIQQRIAVPRPRLP